MAIATRSSQVRARLLTLGLSAVFVAGCAANPGAAPATFVPSADRPGEPMSLSVALDGNVLRATWAAPANQGGATVESYRVFAGNRSAVTIPASVTEYQLSGLGPTEPLLVQVAAVSDAGQGPAAKAEVNRPEPLLDRAKLAAVSGTSQKATEKATATTPATMATPTPTPTPTVTVTPPVVDQAPTIDEDFVALYKRVAPSVVLVSNDSCSGDFVGTAFFVGPDLLATDAHVVKDFRSVQVEVDGKQIAAEVIGYDLREDLALLRIGQVFPERELSFAANFPAVGSQHIVIGHAEYGRGVGKSLQRGTVSAVDVTYNGLPTGSRKGMVQSDVQTNHGASGGPLLTRDGRVIGMVDLAIGDPQNIHLAIGSPTAAAKIARWKTSPVAMPPFC